MISRFLNTPISTLNRLPQLRRALLKYLSELYLKNDLPESLQQLAIENNFMANPICLIDRDILWFGEPISSADFIAVDSVISTSYRSIIRFVGRHLAEALYRFLEMD